MKFFTLNNKLNSVFGLMIVFFSTVSLAQVPFQNNVDEVLSLQIGQEYFISTEDIQVRSSDSSTSKDNVLGKLKMNDKVEVFEDARPGSELVAVLIKKSRNLNLGNSNQVYFVGKRFLSTTDILTKRSPYFVIQNVATERTRVYKRCDTSPSCAHQLIFESKMVVGRPEEGTEKNEHAFKTMIGHSRISEWIKFYQDGKAHYPFWYKKGQAISSIPPKAPLNSKGQPDGTLSWGKAWQTKVNGQSTIYGAFGWYAAKLYPAVGTYGVDAQWMHGTIGWGSDGDAAIELTRSMLLNIFSDPGSAGCTRLSNASISYLRHLLPAGTDIYRVYAREATRENPCLSKSFWGSCRQENILSPYRNLPLSRAWSFTMLTDEAQKSGGISADYNSIARSGIVARDGVNVLERGVYQVDQYPNAVESDYRYQPSTGRTGDRYSLDDPFGNNPTQFVGHYLVDEGRFVNYQHPINKKIPMGGLAEFRKSLPTHLQTTGVFTPAPIQYQTKSGDQSAMVYSN